MAPAPVIHEPSVARALLRSLNDGVPPKTLIGPAMELQDPFHRAMTLARLAQKGAPCRDDAIRSAKKVDRMGSYAELWAELLKRMPSPETKQAAVEQVVAMPDGSWCRDAIEAIAPNVGRLRVQLLERALALPGFEQSAGRAVLRAAADSEHRDMMQLLDGAPAELRAHLMPIIAEDLTPALDAAWALPEDKRREELRIITWRSEGEDLRVIRRSIAGKDKVDSAHVLLLTASRADRLGLPEAERWLSEAESAIDNLADEKARKKLQKKVAQSRERMGGKPASKQNAPSPKQETTGKPEASTDGEPEVASEAATSAGSDVFAKSDAPELSPKFTGKYVPRHIFALVDGYQGGLGNPHIQAVARAAPLCVALELDLWLVGFPTKDANSLVEITEAETNIGEGAKYARELLESGRLRVVDQSIQFPGQVIATTPHPERPLDLQAAGQVTMLVGMGRQGLPKRLLNAADGHYEATGKGVSLETATAMGLLADRLARIPLA